MKHNSLWANLLKADSQRRIKFWWNPEITDLFLDKIESESKEWKTPPEWDIVISHYHDKYHHISSKYTINKYWEIKSLKWEIMKYIFYPNKRWPRVRLQIKKIDKKWNHFSSEKELSVLKLMEKNFWVYFKWYSKKKEKPNEYILVPIDWDYNNMRYDNLHYITKKEYYSYKQDLIKTVLIRNSGATTDSLCETFNTKPGYVYSIKTELANKGKLPKFSEYQELQKEIWIEFCEDNFEIYKLLIKCKWQLSNLEIAKLLRPTETALADKQHYYTDKIVRVRKKLTDQWIIPRFNAEFESKREKAVQMIREKAKTGHTNQEIADILWLKKTQIDNLAKQIKKGKA